MIDEGKLEELAKLVRYCILKMTTKAGSGHPTSSLSATDIMVALFFEKLRFDLKNSQNSNNDRVIFSKGHASPLVYALYRVAGVLTDKDIDSYRTFGSVLEGHPNPRFKYADVATGSLGQGLAVGLGMALTVKQEISNSKLQTPKIYVLMGDSETAEGSVWEAIELASYYKLDNLVGIIDVNRLGQSQATMLGHDMGIYKARVEAFGWEAIVCDGHNFEEILASFEKQVKGKPKMIIAKTIKGKGVSFLEDKDGWHGKALSEEDLEKVLKELGKVDQSLIGEIQRPEGKFQISNWLRFQKKSKYQISNKKLKIPYKLGEEVATRKAFGEALVELGKADERIVVLDAEVKNSTYTEFFMDKFPKRSFEVFIAEQAMAGAALGMSKLGKIPFAATFSAFWTRAYDQIRMGAYSRANIKFVGSHAGVSIGEDGPSQMGLEDFSMFRSIFGSVVLCPGDAVATWKLTQAAVDFEGMVYMRTNRPATPVIYENTDEFKIGGSKVVRSSKSDKLTVVACGVTLIEAIKAADELKKDGINVRVIDTYSIKPIDQSGLKKAAKETNNLIITVEDHYPEGGLGDAVLNVFAQNRGLTPKAVGPLNCVRVYKLAVYKMPMSGKPQELLDFEEISAKAIVSKVKAILVDK